MTKIKLGRSILAETFTTKKTPEEYIAKILAAVADVPYVRFRNGKMTPELMERILEAQMILKKLDIFINDSALSRTCHSHKRVFSTRSCNARD